MTCKNHNRLLSFLCCDYQCRSNRMCCEVCKQKFHLNHICKSFGEINDLLSFNSATSAPFGQKANAVSAMQAPINSIFKLFNQFDDNYKSFADMMRSCKSVLQQKVSPPFVKIKMILNGIFHKRLIQFSKQTDKFNKQIEQSSQIIKFLVDLNIKDCAIVVESIYKKMKICFTQMKKKIQVALFQFNTQISKCSFSNWPKFYGPQNKVVQESQKKQSQLRQIKIIPREGQLKKMFEQNKTNQDQQIFNYLYSNIENTFKQVFKFRDPGTVLARQFNSNFVADHVITKPVEVQNKAISRIQQVKTKKTQAKPYTRFVLKNTSIGEKLNKKEILMKLEQLSSNKNYVEDLKQFIIEDPNQFDAQCLIKLSFCFPQLQKFNYIWNFEQDGLRLQKQQVFFQVTRALDKDQKDLKMCQQLLDIYGRFKHLQNITITGIKNFTDKQMKIKNKQLKHLTLGEYLQDYLQPMIPNYLKQQMLCFNRLITVNFFNIQKIDGAFFQELVSRNKQTLKNVWMSECIQLEESVLKSIGNSNVQTLILQQIKAIKHSILVPPSTVTLIVQNCHIKSPKSFINLENASNIKNFSIFQSHFQQQNSQIGDYLIRIISKITPCNIQYLNVGECKTVTNESLQNMKQMTKLKELCIDNTKISLYHFSRAEQCLRNLERLGIVGLFLLNAQMTKMEDENNPITYKTRIQKILKRAPKLKIISLKFQDNLVGISKELLTNINHISLSAVNYKKQYKTKNLKQFVNILKHMKKSINVV